MVFGGLEGHVTVFFTWDRVESFCPAVICGRMAWLLLQREIRVYPVPIVKSVKVLARVGNEVFSQKPLVQDGKIKPGSPISSSFSPWVLK